MTTVTRDGVVEFRFYRPDVQQVSVVGCFNGWRKDALLMNAQGDGWWRAEIMLQGGDYRFRYLADGVWFPDYASNGIEMGKTGWDSLLVIPKTQRSKIHMRETRQVA
jgi:1,4-alpha-glucan branching enzyme